MYFLFQFVPTFRWNDAPASSSQFGVCTHVIKVGMQASRFNTICIEPNFFVDANQGDVITSVGIFVVRVLYDFLSINEKKKQLIRNRLIEFTFTYDYITIFGSFSIAYFIHQRHLFIENYTNLFRKYWNLQQKKVHYFSQSNNDRFTFAGNAMGRSQYEKLGDNSSTAAKANIVILHWIHVTQSRLQEMQN